MPPSRAQRLAAISALVCAAVLVVGVVLLLLADPGTLLLALVGLALAGAGAWWLVTERRVRRLLGAIALAAGVVLLIAAILRRLDGFDARAAAILLLLALVALVTGQARLAVARGLHEDEGVLFPPPKHPVLIANRKSGGGKVGRFGLAEAAEEQGVEVVLLEPGDDLEQLARDAVARGADCLGMAGGDGSQALVASVAAEHDLPFVCVSAGTRNHFALDLGLNRDDPREGIAAFSQGVERRIDYATVGERLFVNNVSMGVYATIVQQQAYRDAKLATSRDLLPELLGARTEPFDLQFTAPDGTEVDGAFLILVSNNPYVLGPRLDISQRRSLTTGRLGVFAVNARTGPEAATLLARSTFGLGARDPHVHQFEAETFTLRSRSGTAFAGVDGEALDLPTPLVFTSHPRGLRVRLPASTEAHRQRSAARNVALADLVRVARGRPMRGAAIEPH